MAETTPIEGFIQILATAYLQLLAQRGANQRRVGQIAAGEESSDFPENPLLPLDSIPKVIAEGVPADSRNANPSKELR